MDKVNLFKLKLEDYLRKICCNDMIINHNSFCVIVENILSMIDFLIKDINIGDINIKFNKNHSINIVGNSNNLNIKICIDYYEDILNYSFSRYDLKSKERRFKNYSVSIGTDKSLNFEIERSQFCNNSANGISIEMLKYDAGGIMIKRDYKRYTAKMVDSLEVLSNSSFNLTNNNYVLYTNQFDFHISMIRKMLDVVSLKVECDDSIYDSFALLDTDHGLRDMNLKNNELKTPRFIEILPLNNICINNLIYNKFNSSCVREALIPYSFNRDVFLYDSRFDDEFVCSGFFNGDFDNESIIRFTKLYQGSGVN